MQDPHSKGPTRWEKKKIEPKVYFSQNKYSTQLKGWLCVCVNQENTESIF